jgi:hypothetical protein
MRAAISPEGVLPPTGLEKVRERRGRICGLRLFRK